MIVHVEFFGIPRRRAGVPSAQCEFPEQQTTLGVILCDLEKRFPDFGSDCIFEGKFAPSVVANLAGERFIRDTKTEIDDGQTLLIMSADAGG